MTDTTITTNIHQTLNVKLNLTAEVALYLILCTNNLTDAGCHIISPILSLDVFIHTSLGQNLGCAAATNTKNVG